MKTSNYIILGFLIFFFACILAMFIDDKMYYKNSSILKENRYNRIAKTTEKLDPFSVVIVEKNCNVDFISDSIQTLTYIVQKLDQDKDTTAILSIEKPMFNVVNDTLYISKTQTTKIKKFIQTVRIHTNSLKNVIAKDKSVIHFDNFHKSDHLNIQLNNANLTGNIRVKNVSIQGMGSKLNLSNAAIDDLNIQANNCSVNMMNRKNRIKKVHLDIKNGSNFASKKINKMTVDVDDSSRFKVYNGL